MSGDKMAVGFGIVKLWSGADRRYFERCIDVILPRSSLGQMRRSHAVAEPITDFIIYECGR